MCVVVLKSGVNLETGLKCAVCDFPLFMEKFRSYTMEWNLRIKTKRVPKNGLDPRMEDMSH